MIQITPLVTNEDTKLIKAKALHVDTVKISHAYRSYDLPPPEELEDKGFELTFKRRKNSNNIKSNSIITAHLKPTYSTRYHLTVIKSDFGYCGINIELSLAKYHGDSGLGIQTEDDIESVFYEIEFIIRELVGVKFDPHTAKVTRLDVNADFPVGDDRLYSYLNAISRPNSRYTPAAFGDTTRQFHNKSRKLIVYGKYEELKKQVKKGRATIDDLEAAKGLLRLEVSLRKAPINRLAKKLNLSAEASQLINLSVANHIVSEGLHQLRLDMTKISNDKLYRLMSENFGTDAPLMLGIIQYREAFGDDFWKVFGWSPATYYRKIKRLKAANLWDISPDEELPALGLP